MRTHLQWVAGACAFALATASPARGQDGGEGAYRRARAELARGVLDSAIAGFERYRAAHPEGRRASETRYWEAFARYRRNAGDDLARAAVLLAGPSATASHPDARALAARIAARRGVQSAGLEACGPENGLVFAEVLAGRDAHDDTGTEGTAHAALAEPRCPVVGRRAAVGFLGSRTSGNAREALRGAVLRDAAPQVRSDALAHLAGDSAIATLGVVARAIRSDSARLVALTAADVLSRLHHPATVDTLLALLADPAIAPTRQAAVLSWSRLDGRARPTPAAVRQLFAVLVARGSLGATALEFVARRGGPEDRAWVWAQVGNPANPTMVRLTGMQQVGASRSVRELRALFGGDTPRLLRFGVLEQLRNHADPAATEALRGIIAAEPPGTVREAARAALAARSR